jgi:hypothetical protein
MAHSFVEYHNQTRMMHDIEILIIVNITLDTLQDLPDHPRLTTNIRALFDFWKNHLDTYCPGCIELNLNNYVLSDADNVCLLKLFALARQKVCNFGSIVSGDYLNRVIDVPAVLEFVDRPISDILPAFDKFIALLHTEETDWTSDGPRKN